MSENENEELEKIKESKREDESAEIVCITFTYPRDAGKAAVFGAMLPKEWRRVWCLESKDAGMPVPEGVEVLLADFPRGGSLKDAGAIIGMREVYLRLLRDFKNARCFIKLDSDTALYCPRAWTAPILESGADFTFVRRKACEGSGLANGCCYAMSRAAIERLSRFYPYGIPAQFRGHEDLIFSAFFTNIETDLQSCSLDKMRVSWSVREYFNADILAGHYGYYSFDDACTMLKRTLEENGRGAEFTFPRVSEYLEKLRAYKEAKDAETGKEAGTGTEEETEKATEGACNE